MRTLTIILALVIGFGAGLVAPVVMADWTEGENQRFFEHVARVAESINNAATWGNKLSAIAVSEDITNDPQWIDESPWVKAEVLAMKDVIDTLNIFLRGGAVIPDCAQEASCPIDAINAMLLGLN